MMGSIRRKPLAAFFGLALLSLTVCLARPMPGRSYCHRSNFQVLGLRLHKRSGTSSFSTRSPPAVRPWDVNRRATPTTISCTARRTRGFGRVGASDPRRTRFTAPVSFSKMSLRRITTRSKSGVRRVARSLRMALHDLRLGVRPGLAGSKLLSLCWMPRSRPCPLFPSRNELWGTPSSRCCAGPVEVGRGVVTRRSQL
jgi:hypothetical protein